MSLEKKVFWICLIFVLVLGSFALYMNKDIGYDENEFLGDAISASRNNAYDSKAQASSDSKNSVLYPFESFNKIFNYNVNRDYYFNEKIPFVEYFISFEYMNYVSNRKREREGFFKF
jgi:hypothetical protein